MRDSPVSTNVNFDRDGVQHGPGFLDLFATPGA